MCFYKDVTISGRFHKIADENIDCYKAMVISKIGNDGVVWVKSLHYPKDDVRSYGGIMTPAIEHDLDWLDVGTIVLESGVIHSYICPPHIYCGNACYIGQEVIVKCHIPEGTPYWANTREGAYASTKLLTDGIVNYS